MANGKIITTSFKNASAPTISSDAVSNLNGGYKTKDRFTIVNLRIKVVKTFSVQDYRTIFSGFPIPYVAASLSVSDSNNGSLGASARVTDTGSLILYAGDYPLTNETIYITGAYLNA